MAQNKIDKINVTYGQELPDDKQKLVDITGEANGKIYGLAIKGKDTYMLKIFDSGTMAQKSSHEIIIPDLNDKEVEFENLYLLNGKLYVVGSVYNKKEKIFNLVATPLSEEGKLSKDGVVLFKSEVEKKSARGGFYFRKTQDENGLLVMHASRFDKEDAVKYDIKLFDDNLKAIFSTTEKVKFDDNHKDYEFYIPDFQAGLNDDVYVVINEGYRDNKKKERVERFEIHAYKSAKNYTKEVINIDVKDQSPINCKIVPSGDILHLMGFYSSVRESGRSNKELKGVYAATVNMKDNSVTNVKFNDLDMPTRVKLLGERRAKKGKDVPPLYNIIQIIGREDGGMIMVSEYQLVVIGQSSGIGPLAFTPVTYIKNEIIVTSLAPDGTHEWSNVLPKEQAASVTTMSLGLGFGGVSNGFAVGGTVMIPLLQMGKGPEYLGALPIYKNGELSILINDNVKNKGITDIEEIKSMGNYNNAVPSLFIFGKDGKITRKDPEEVVKNELVIRPGVNYSKTDNEYIIYSSRKKSDKLGRMFLLD
ncbi:hypothetical protein ACLI09_15280 [Flavobacterium sp. RHBU_24]|uniref:hypothetical protein n=1 Tax=Flavobacterium sp. RHBU_24 TaxID=3391185 RepID=UPI0039849DA7